MNPPPLKKLVFGFSSVLLPLPRAGWKRWRQKLIPMVISLAWFSLAPASESFSETGRHEEVIPMPEGTDVHQRGKLLLLMAVATAVALGLTRNSWRR